MNQEERYITDEEITYCQKVADAFTELYEKEDIVVVSAGKYGFAELRNYMFPYGFSTVTTYTDSRSLFEGLWEEWLETQLLLWAAGTPMADLDNEDIFKCLPQEKQEALKEKRLHFAEMAGLGDIFPEDVFAERNRTVQAVR